MKIICEIISYFLLAFNFVAWAVPVDKVEDELSQVGSKDSTHSIVYESPVFISQWPSNILLDYLGQVSSVSFCPKGYLFIFQRAGRRMENNLFNNKNEFITEEYGPIRQSTILKMNNKLNDPKVVAEIGADIFYLPHGIFTDKKYIWATDLGLHQVLRIPHGKTKPDFTLGQQFQPGNDQSHFCKPTHAVTAQKDGSIFVADGYCNSRIVKFDSSGKFITQFGDKGSTKVSIPHHLVLIESRDLICVADRENHRVQCFCAGLNNSTTTGQLVRIIDDESLGPVYAIGYNPSNDLLYISSGIDEENSRSKVYIYNWNLNTVIGEIDFPGDYGFGLVHSLSVSPRGKFLAIGGLSKECPADLLTCLAQDNRNDELQMRNLWLYGLVDENMDLNN